MIVFKVHTNDIRMTSSSLVLASLTFNFKRAWSISNEETRIANFKYID